MTHAARDRAGPGCPGCPGCACGASSLHLHPSGCCLGPPLPSQPLGPPGPPLEGLEGGGMPAGRHVTPGICEEDRKHAKYIIQIWGEGAIWESLCGCDSRRCGTGRDMGSLTVDHISRRLLYNPPAHPLGRARRRARLIAPQPSRAPGQGGRDQDFARGCSLFLASRQAARQQGHGPHQAVPALVIR